ncbi:hypothetical protein HanPI659440_Chr13g0484411 [Helianthus annuus]|nr:hypothetical protein HanPI659440_Chr13g0484411 [Helianthus annuus]
MGFSRHQRKRASLEFSTKVVRDFSTAVFRSKLFPCRMEIVADYIRILLMTSARYDPWVAPKVYEKMGQVFGDSGLEDYYFTHPSGKTRGGLLFEASVM